jgi:hypothetical protein
VRYRVTDYRNADRWPEGWQMLSTDSLAEAVEHLRQQPQPPERSIIDYGPAETRPNSLRFSFDGERWRRNGRDVGEVAA